MATLISIDQENIAAPISGGGKALMQPTKKMMAKTPSQPSRTLQPTRGFGVDLTKATNNTANHSGGGSGKGGVKGVMKQGGTKATQQQQPEIVLIQEIEKAHNPKAVTSKQRAERRKKKIETIAMDLKKPQTTVQGFLTSPFMMTEEVSLTDLGEALRATHFEDYLDTPLCQSSTPISLHLDEDFEFDDFATKSGIPTPGTLALDLDALEFEL